MDVARIPDVAAVLGSSQGLIVRIVIVISNLIFGGAETQVIALSAGLTKRGHAVAIYTLNANNPRAEELSGSGVRLVSDQKNWKFDVMVMMRLRRFIKDFKADIVHGFLFDGDFYSRLASVGTRVPVINSERNDNYRLNFNQRIGHWLTHRLADAVVANSYAGAGFARRLFASKKNAIHVVWNGLDVYAIDRRTGNCEQNYAEHFFGRPVKIACLVGAIKPQKDYLLALKIAHCLTKNHSEWRVLFVGDQLGNTGEYKQTVMQAYEQLALAGRAVFAGLRRDVPEIISQCCVLFSTSLHEGFPNVVLEAMAVGTPVVSALYSDIGHILPMDWQVVPDRSVERFVTAILRADAENKVVRGQQRQWVEAHATVECASARLETIYKLYAIDKTRGRLEKGQGG